MILPRVEQHKISPTHSLYKLIDEYAFLTKNLYNYANYHVRQVFITTSKLKNGEPISEEQKQFLSNINKLVDDYNVKKLHTLREKQSKGKNTNKIFTKLNYFNEEHKVIQYDFLDFIMSSTKDYKAILAQVAQQTLKLVMQNWKSFFESMKKYKVAPDSFTGRPNLPNYKHKTKGRFNIVFTNQNCNKKDNNIIFPKCFNQYNLKTKVNGKLKQVRIKPLNKHYLLEVVYEKEIVNTIEPNNNILGIDLGINNFVTMTNNIGLTPIIINGRIIKSINQYYNKSTAFYKSILKKETDRDYSNKINKLTTKRNNKVKDFMHKTSRFIVDYCIENNITNIVVGNNKHWKQEIQLGSVTNQNFVQIPYSMLISQLQYKCENVSIKFIISEESYTSKASFLDGDIVPVYSKEQNENYVFSGKRIKRGLYKSKNNILINADVNGRYNIVKKVFPNAFADGIEGLVLHPFKLNIA